jgi:hypothetical protein
MEEERRERHEPVSTCECINTSWTNVPDTRLAVLNEISELSMEIHACKNANLSNPMMRQQMQKKIINLDEQLVAKRVELEFMCQCISLPCTNDPGARLTILNEISDLSMEIDACQNAKLSNPMMRQQMKKKVIILDERLVDKRRELASMCQHISTSSCTSCMDATVVRLTSLDESITSLSTTRAEMMKKVYSLDRQLREKKRERASVSKRNVLDAYSRE